MTWFRWLNQFAAALGTLAISGPSINSPFSSTPPAFYHYSFTTVFSLHTSIITQARDSHTWPFSDKTPQHKIRKRRRSYSQGSSNGDSNFKKIWLHCGSRNNKSKGIEICKSVEPRQSKMFNRKWKNSTQRSYGGRTGEVLPRAETRRSKQQRAPKKPIAREYRTAEGGTTTAQVPRRAKSLAENRKARHWVDEARREEEVANGDNSALAWNCWPCKSNGGLLSMLTTGFTTKI
jgi:hypothetical protein